MAPAFFVAGRYGSASELADDIHRFLAVDPVAAHARSAIYLIRKYAWNLDDCFQKPVTAT